MIKMDLTKLQRDSPFVNHVNLDILTEIEVRS